MSVDVPSDSKRICFREINEADADGVVNLLTAGFQRDGRSREFWGVALRRLSEHSTPEGFPKYGYLLEYESTPVGVILLIFSSVADVCGARTIRCNVSSWYVAPAFRCYASMFVSRALKRKKVTYFNISPRRHTHPILELQGYKRYAAGRLVCFPTLSSASSGCRVTTLQSITGPGEDLSSSEIELLSEHSSYGCISLVCHAASGRHPFVFMRRKKHGLPFAYLAYCRDLSEFVRFAAPLGRFLLNRKLPIVVLDSNGKISGLVGIYSDGFPKYFKGPAPPRLGDYAYSERVIFGV